MEQSIAEVLSADVREEAITLPEQALLMPVTCPEEYDFAEDWIRTVLGPLREQIRGTFRPHISRAHELHRSLIADEKRFLDPIEKADQIVRGAMRNYALVLERERAEAEKRSREERERAELRVRIESWGLTVFSAISYAATCLAEDERRRACAAAAEKAGDVEAAESYRSEVGQHADVPPPAEPEPFVAPAVVVPDKPKGIAENWKARLKEPDGKMRLIRFVAQHPEWEGLLDLNESTADKAAKSLKGNLERLVDGLEGYNDPTVRVGRKH